MILKKDTQLDEGKIYWLVRDKTPNKKSSRLLCKLINVYYSKSAPTDNIYMFNDLLNDKRIDANPAKDNYPWHYGLPSKREIALHNLTTL